MDVKNIGKNIATLRKKHGMTQTALAEELKISNKTVSKWESGQGYPEISQLPSLAHFFNVSIDSLMTDKPGGIAIAGNILTDVVKMVDCYPEKGMLANIGDMSVCVGGCVPNTAIDIAKIDRSLPLTAIGKVGDDDNGRFVVAKMIENGINCDKVIVSQTKPTSSSDVISSPDGERTFFHCRGANAEFAPDDIDINALNCSIFHIGYILLLDVFDQEDKEYGTVMARFLHSVQKKGIKTSIDVVSDSTGEYKKKIIPALKYCDYVIVNEIESSIISGLNPYTEDKKPNLENIKKTMEIMADYGVSEKIIIHCKQAGFCYDVKTKEFVAVGSVDMPRELFKGSAGAGDAFCAGSLYGIYNGFSNKEILEFAGGAAVCNLLSENSIDGMLSKPEIYKVMEKYGYMEV